MFIEWFYNHPSLRYGGYHIIALLMFIPSSLILSKINIYYEVYVKRSLILLVITILIFVSRNVSRLNNEYNQYGYNIFDNSNFLFIDGEKKSYFRYSIQLEENKNKNKKIDFFGKKIINTTFQD